MVPNGSAYANYPSFANNGTKTPPGGSPESAKYALGMVPADTFPAEWANWLFHGATAGITRLNADVGSIKKEINSLLAAYNITPDASVFNQLYLAIEKRISSLYPVGTIYQNASDSTNPGDATMLGFGTWEQITDKFLAARGSTNIGASGGAWSYTLTSANIPQHKHGMQHYHYTNINHGHGVTDPGHFHAHIYADAPNANETYWQNTEGASVGGWPRVATYVGDTAYVTKLVTGYAQTGISVNGTGDLQKFSSGSLANDQWAGRTETDAYGSANPTAISITPTYVGVYTWKRTV